VHCVELVIISETRVEISFICVLQDCSWTFSWRWRRLHATVPFLGLDIEEGFGREFSSVTFPRPVEM
jgi:hypothetical protein